MIDTKLIPTLPLQMVPMEKQDAEDQGLRVGRMFRFDVHAELWIVVSEIKGLYIVTPLDTPCNLN